MRASRCPLACLGLLLAVTLILSSCSMYPYAYMRPATPGPRGVRFVGVYEEKAELVPGLRSARSIKELKRVLDASDQPGGTYTRALFRVETVLDTRGTTLRPGDRLCLIFRTPKTRLDPTPLPNRYLGKTLQVVMYDGFKHRYAGRFFCSIWRPAPRRAKRQNTSLDKPTSPETSE